MNKIDINFLQPTITQMARRIKQIDDFDLNEQYNRTHKAFPSPKYVAYDKLVVGKIYYAASIFQYESFVIHEKYDNYYEIQYVDNDGMCTSKIEKLERRHARNIRFGQGIQPVGGRL